MAAMWSMGRRLTTIAAGSDTFYYRYNADGIRTAKTVNGVQHLLMYVYDANG